MFVWVFWGVSSPSLLSVTPRSPSSFKVYRHVHRFRYLFIFCCCQCCFDNDCFVFVVFVVVVTLEPVVTVVVSVLYSVVADVFDGVPPFFFW